MATDPDHPSWSVEGADWPNRAHSRFVKAAGGEWHVQDIGTGPSLLLLHGTGAATHSFRDLAPLLAADFRVVVPDLPGHGFTRVRGGDGLSLPGMARAVRDLIRQSDIESDIAVGHSAGAAVLVRMALDGMIRPKVIVAINGALRPIRGAALFSPLAKLLFLNPFMPRLFARRAMRADATRRLLEGTGSRIDTRGVELYGRLFQKPGHVAGTLGMMANWNLDRFEDEMKALKAPLVLVTASGDRAVPPSDAAAIAARVPQARHLAIDHGGHLIHEEEPDAVARLIKGIAVENGVLAR